MKSSRESMEYAEECILVLDLYNTVIWSKVTCICKQAPFPPATTYTIHEHVYAYLRKSSTSPSIISVLGKTHPIFICWAQQWKTDTEAQLK